MKLSEHEYIWVSDDEIMVYLGLCFLAVFEEVELEELMICAREQGFV
jgi:hypothetical protein